MEVKTNENHPRCPAVVINRGHLLEKGQRNKFNDCLTVTIKALQFHTILETMRHVQYTSYLVRQF